ncbi:ProB (plasmid) [Planktothrix tepida]|uniref:ProB n=1 Tax=Planktothrix tepida PCC 9214 TaxID=671072 RepID=A0A1J1LN33_9CYAN|nr:hypothetical protein [Planktothrix tepida]CAD5988682.1 ProB [Planktothrix tepida]CUR33960.1 ProB [Planktothrix tepida PCC 9214]
MSLIYDYLKSKIVNINGTNRWLGKDVLEIAEDLINLVNGGVNNFPPTQILTGLTEPILDPIKNIAEQLLTLPDISISSALLTLETCYGINKAFNTKLRKNQDLISYGNSLLNSIPSSDDQYYYSMGVEAWNESLNIPLLNSELNNLQSKIGSIQSNVNSKINEFENKFGLDYIQSTIQSLEALGESATETIKNQLYRLKAFVKKLTNQSSNNQQSLNAIQINYNSLVISPIKPVRIPNLTDVVGVIHQLAGWFLSIFSISGQALTALAHTVTSVVCKAIGSVGANASRYLAAGVLKSLPQLVPKVGSATGTLFGGAWAFLMAYAPYIALVAGLILIAIKWSKKTKLGEFIYLIGTTNNGNPDLGFARVAQMNEAQIRSYIIDFANRMINESLKTYQNFYGFILNNSQEITLCLNFNNLTLPQTINDEATKTSLWESFKPFLDEFSED